MIDDSELTAHRHARDHANARAAMDRVEHRIDVEKRLHAARGPRTASAEHLLHPPQTVDFIHQRGRLGSDRMASLRRPRLRSWLILVGVGIVLGASIVAGLVWAGWTP